jgi:hypothetical protein
VRRHEIRQESKKNGEYACEYVRRLTKEVQLGADRIASLDHMLEKYLHKIVMQTTYDLDTESGLEKHLKAAIKK